jgi:uncharacterized protein YjbI with pentapeptide repeats
VHGRDRARLLGLVVLAVILAVLATRLVGTGNGTEDRGRRCPAGQGTDLSGRQVAAADLSQQQMPCINLERSTLDGSVSQANLSRANLHRAHLRSTWMEDVDLSAADLTDARGEAVILTGVKLVGADLRRIALSKARFENVGLQQAQLGGADLRGASLTRTDLAGADARDVNLTGAALFDSNLRGARLDGAKLGSVTWSNVVCPDGTKSSADERESCDAHLKPAR